MCAVLDVYVGGGIKCSLCAAKTSLSPQPHVGASYSSRNLNVAQPVIADLHAIEQVECDHVMQIGQDAHLIHDIVVIVRSAGRGARELVCVRYGHEGVQVNALLIHQNGVRRILPVLDGIEQEVASCCFNCYPAGRLHKFLSCPPTHPICCKEVRGK